MPAAPSLLIVPYRSKTGKLYSQIPTSGTGDFTVTRNTEARRVNSAGLIASVASGIPRLDYLTSGGTAGCPALLVEPAATNGILNSADTTTNWTLGANLTSGAIDVIGVSGNNLTVAVSGSGIGDSTGRVVRFSNNVALASGSTYTLSFLMKKTGAHTIGGFQFFIATGSIAAGFDVSGSFSSGSIANTAPTTNRIRRVEQWGTDVYRCSETFTMTATATGTHLAFAPLAAVASSPNSAVGTSMGFAAPQIELSSVPTSFIPTTAGTGSRSADVISVSGAVSGSIGQTEGTVYVDLSEANTIDNPLITVDDGTNNNRIVLFRQVSTGNWSIFTASAGAGGITSSSVSNNFGKFAIAYSSSGYSVYRDGVEILTRVAALPLSLNTIRLNGRATLDQFSTKRILAFALYTTRLTNAELQSLTTL